MAQVEHAIKDYGRKVGWIRSKEYRVMPVPALWQRENNKLIRQAFNVLQSGLVAVPLISGMDKFVNVLADWPQYLFTAIPEITGFSASSIMMLAGLLEIFLALGIALWPRIFSAVFMFWMMAVIFNFLMSGHFLDIALRDLGILVAAFALWRLSSIKEDVPELVSKTELDTPHELSTTELAH